MPILHLCLENLGQLNDGLAGGIVNSAIQRMLDDLEDRGAQDEEKRVVKIEIIGQIKEKILTVQVKAGCTLPKYNAGVTVGKLKSSLDGGRAHNVFEFRGDSPENPHQQTLDDAEVDNDDK